MGKLKNLAGANNLSMKRNLRMAILASLSLQVFLIFFGPIRKRYSKRWIGKLIWLAYLAADLVVDYAFGLMVQAQSSSGMSDSEANAYGDLLAFWAPFLLPHLGGPDTVTVIALEDNELWGRHLLSLLFQVGTASYVFYQSFPNSRLIVPTIFLFIGGTIKYIERTCALYFASFSGLRRSLLPPAQAGPNYAEIMKQHVATGRTRPTTNPDFHMLERKNKFGTTEQARSRKFFTSNHAKDAFRIIQGELNFFYDVLYTKAAIVHRPTGYLFRAISLGSIVAAFAYFYVLNKHGFHEYDIHITYTFLLGAVSLEFVALGLLICSDWTIAKIGTCEEHHRSQFKVSIFIKFFLMVKSESSPFALPMICARWSRSLFQYNLIESRLRKWPKWIEKLIDPHLRMREWLEDLKSERMREWLEDLKSERVEPYSKELGELIFIELREKASSWTKRKMTRFGRDECERKQICSARGEWALEYRTKNGQDCQNLLPFIRDVDYGESFLLWHIATELCYNKDENKNNHCDSSKVLSDYMLHLMIKEPDLMSVVIGIGQIRFRDTCADLDSLLDVTTTPGPRLMKGDRSKSVLFDACILAKELDKLQENKWEIVSEVWVELLAHAAINCRPYMHAQQLSKGGELVALVWLLTVHLGLSEQFQIAWGHANIRPNLDTC
ncbi:hypothetical protein BT93_B0583 [Corymbia citriodora subsp. variegata]|nr:hypothetical protein BT93_B0583 [Corymbia citriodora subsp. variegata]KAF8037782.1 hypothetical protein BT93_B0583 [Corymbia citriodora subsp. variegata]